MFDAEQKKWRVFFMAVYSCIDQALAFFFNKMRSCFEANPNLTAVKIYGVWLLVHGVLQSSEVGFIANVDLNFVSLDLCCMSGVQRNYLLNSWSANNFPLLSNVK